MAMVCLCHGVNERRVRAEIEHGAHTLAEVTAACAAGGCCQSCHPSIEALLDEHAATELAGVRRGRRLLRLG
ncbi:MAG: (2Fe-2S)-binding protein [Desertimonas sp.]